MKTLLGLCILSVLLLAHTFAAEESTVNLQYKAPMPASYQAPYDNDIAYAAQSVPFVFDYLPPVLPRDSWTDPKVTQLQRVLGDATDLQGRIDFCDRIEKAKCDPYYWFRQPDGSCNNLNITWWGAAYTPAKRLLRPQYADNIGKPRVVDITGRRLKSPREVSLKVHYPQDVKKDITHYVAAFGQFAVHDVVELAKTLGEKGQPVACTCETANPECFNMELSGNDYFFKNQKCHVMTRLRDSRVDFDCDFGYRNQLNRVTSFVDASQVYGNTKEQEADLRTFYGGQMKVSYLKDSSGPLLPVKCKASDFIETTKTNVCFVTGDRRANENPQLTGLHTVFVRLHNLYAAKLYKVNPYWSDERLFQEAKRIASAVYQHIVYAEWLPLIVGYELHKVMNLEPAVTGYFEDYDERIFPGTTVEFSVAAARFGHAIYSPYMTKADVNYYPISNITLRDTLHRPDLIVKGDNLDQFMRGCMFDRISQNLPHITEDLFNWLTFDQGNHNPTKFFPLPAVNINRGREVGLPPYAHYRNLAGLNFPYSFDDLSWISPQKVKRLKAAYYNVLDIDLYPGGLSEQHVRGGIVGPTFAYIIARGYRDWKYGDRWFYENSPSTTPLAFTPAQLSSIKQMTLAAVLCSTLNIKEIPTNVFLKADKVHNPVVSCSSIYQPDFRLFAAVPDDVKWNSPWAVTPPANTNPVNPYAETNPVNWIYPGQAPGYATMPPGPYSYAAPATTAAGVTTTTAAGVTTTTVAGATTTTTPYY